MKTTIVAVTFALCSAACAGSNPPAQDPSSAAAETTTPVAQNGPVTTGASMTPGSTPSTTATPPPNSGATSMMAPGANAGSMSPPAATTPVTDAPSTAPANPAGDHAGSPDNTRVNARDRNGTLTPMNQGNSTSEIGITASIRKGVMRDGTLSFTAKNVKIITVGSTVTLRGPVKSDAERTTIENLARQTAGVTSVDDQLEVK
ncbi:MAG TPA: BON domain-containing protein [Polyangiaceae bacterium]